MPISCVVDASVLAKWYLDETWSAQARELREDFVAQAVEVVGPTLLIYEVMRALQKSGPAPEDLKRACEALIAYRFSLVPLRGDVFRETLRLMLDRRLTTYDASYIAVAKVLNVPLWTADEPMEDGGRGIVQVHHIKDYAARNGGTGT